MIWTKISRDDYWWHRWFAWYPVEVYSVYENGVIVEKRAWLSTIWRKRKYDFVGSWWEYSIEKPDDDRMPKDEHCTSNTRG